MKRVIEGVEGIGKTSRCDVCHGHSIYVRWNENNFNKDEFRRMLTSTSRNIVMDGGELSQMVRSALWGKEFNLDAFQEQFKDYVEFCDKEKIGTTIIVENDCCPYNAVYRRFTVPPMHKDRFGILGYALLKQLWEIIYELYSRYDDLFDDTLTSNGRNATMECINGLWMVFSSHVYEIRKCISRKII